jgi:cytochrome c biogenesis protein CcdA
MPALALAVIAIALPDSLNPSLIVAAVYLALGARPVRRTALFTAATFAVTLAGGLAIALGLGDLVLSLLPKLSHTVKWDVAIAVGVILMCGGVVIWWRREALVADPETTRKEPSAHGSALLMGAGIAGVELVTAFPYFAAIAVVLGSSVAAPAKVSLLVLYNVIYVTPLIAIVVVRATMGEKGAELLLPVSDWIQTRWPLVVAPVAGVAGAALTAYGILQLT